MPENQSDQHQALQLVKKSYFLSEFPAELAKNYFHVGTSRLRTERDSVQKKQFPF